VRNELLRDEEGAATAEYAIVIMAAVALAGVLVAVVQSDAVRQIIEDLVINAFG
jgi:Flp pilus assembly pilin Flp